MTDGDDIDEKVLQSAGGLGATPPPLSPALRQAVATIKPVRTRTRFGGFLVVALTGSVWPLVALTTRPFRRDLAALPPLWVMLAAALWAAAFAGSLLGALVPRRTDVLPAPARASRLALTALVGLLMFALVASVETPTSMHPSERGWSLFDSCVHCAVFVVETVAVFLAAGLVAMRRLVPVGGPSIGLALGVAGGAMGGFVLHFLCPFAATAHVVFGHVGGVVLAGAAGAIVLSLLSRFRP